MNVTALGFFDPKRVLDSRREREPRLTRVALFKFQQAELQEKLAKMYNVSDEKCVSIFGFRTAFGGGKSTGFGLIYDNIEAFKKFEPKHRLIRAGLKDAVQKSRKNIKEKEEPCQEAPWWCQEQGHVNLLLLFLCLVEFGRARPSY